MTMRFSMLHSWDCSHAEWLRSEPSADCPINTPESVRELTAVPARATDESAINLGGVKEEIDLRSRRVVTSLTGRPRGCGLLDELGCLLRMRHVGHMAGFHFDRPGTGAFRHHPLLVRIDRSVFGGHHVRRGLG